jgi:hypothetical protein
MDRRRIAMVAFFLGLVLILIAFLFLFIPIWMP